MDKFGFIIIRHVNSERTNKYWNNCVKCLRALYPFKKILIIDDNSDTHFLKADFDYKNVIVIESEFKGRGELLPYYYYLKYKYFENAIIIHDSVFFHKRIPFELLNGEKVIPLWFFHSDKENLNNTLRISSNLTNSHFLQQKLSLENNILGMPQYKWYGCFGVQCYINHNFLVYINSKYNLTNLITAVSCRADRCCLERILGCIFCSENNRIVKKTPSIFGNIMKYQTWGYTFEQYESDLKNSKLPKAIVKVWTGR